MPGRVEKRMVWWEERDGPSLRMCSRAETQPRANIARIPVANSTGVSTTSPSTAAVVASACTAATLGTFKAIVDHGRGVAVASLLAVVCCSTKCWYQRSRTSRTVAAAFGFASASPSAPPSALPSATLLYTNLGVHSCLMFQNKCISSSIQVV